MFKKSLGGNYATIKFIHYMSTCLLCSYIQKMQHKHDIKKKEEYMRKSLEIWYLVNSLKSKRGTIEHPWDSC